MSVWASTSRRLYIIKVEETYGMYSHPHLPFQNHEDEETRFLCPDDSGGFWIATSMGRILYGQPKDSVFKISATVSTRKGMTILNLLWRNHHLWLVSHNRFIHYDTQRHSLQQYTSSDGNMSLLSSATKLHSFRPTVRSTPEDAAVSYQSLPLLHPPLRLFHVPVMLTDFKSGMRSMLFNPSGRYVSGQPDRNTLPCNPKRPTFPSAFPL